jgi:MYXO-CTERM domain-containing protein
MKSQVHAASRPDLEARPARTATKQALRSSWSATWTKAAAALIGAVGVFAYIPRAEAQCLQCNASSETSSCSTADAWGFCCVPGFVLADDNANGTASVSMTIGTNSLQFKQTINSSGCCVAPYANIGIFDACQQSDQYGQAGSHLPIQLSQLALLKAAWTFQVPLPLKANEQYRVYYEMFLSTTAAGHTDGGNLTGVVFWSNFGFDPPTGHAPINGTQGMDVIDYHGQVGQGQGPFVDFLYPAGTFAPDSTGVVTVPSVDLKAILDWAVANFPNYYTNNLYISSLSLAVEAGAFVGTVTTSYASFAVQKTGSPTVYTPPWTASHWTSCSTAADCDDGNPCTTDACTSNQCSNVPVPGCSDAGASSGSSSGSASNSSSVHGSSSSRSSSKSASGSASGGSNGSASGGSNGASNASSSGTSTSGGSYIVGSATSTRNTGNTGDAGADGFTTTPGSGGCSTAAAGSRSGAFAAFWLLGLAVIGRRRPRGPRGGSAR